MAVVLPATPASAQDAATSELEGVEPPKLQQSIDPIYPAEALAQGIEGTVVLRLTIDVEGHVVEADVAESCGHGLDEAAQAAALASRFTPARRGGQSVSARILYRVLFKLPVAVSAVPAAFTARVLDGGAAVPGLEVTANGADGTRLRATTDADGRASFAGLPAGRYELQVTRGAQQATRVIDARAGLELTVDLELPPLASSRPALPPIEVTVRGSVTPADKLRHSAEAVTVVDTHKAKEQTADLGEVLARTQGVAIRRDAGLGSGSQFSLNGLHDEQVRFFLDGVPLSVAGFPFGIADMPVNLLDRVEIYRGVVPIRFGADALGGAVNLVSAGGRGSHASASYQVGSFGTNRVTAAGRYEDDHTGLYAGASAFLDIAKNDYDVDVQVTDDVGHLHDATVPRFHDAYRAFGVTAEGGVADRSWAERLELRAAYVGYDKELQSNAVMTIPYGGVTYDERVASTNARYEQPLSDKFRLELVAGYARRTIEFQDLSEWVYDWYGQRLGKRLIPGEITGQPHDNIYWQNDVYGRALVAWSLPQKNALRLSSAVNESDRTGTDRTFKKPNARDPLSVRQLRLTVVTGMEWEVNAWNDRIQNIAFAKNYLFHASYEDVLPGNLFVPLTRNSNTVGGGDALRIRPLPWLYLKASYEYATRLPSAEELFGNGVLISPNLKLEPEVSHNANVGPRIEVRNTVAGDFIADVNGFWRNSDNLIVLFGAAQFLTYQNVYRAVSRGVEGEFSWTSPKRWLTLNTTGTYQDLRNASAEGPFGEFEGDRVPNQPWLFASVGARGRIDGLPGRISGVLEPFYVGRYVHSFLRGWESVGDAKYKQTIPMQLSHDIGISYSAHVQPTVIHATFEVDNVGNAKLFDSYGAQRPGRGFYLKFMAEI